MKRGKGLQILKTLAERGYQVKKGLSSKGKQRPDNIRQEEPHLAFSEKARWGLTQTTARQ